MQKGDRRKHISMGLDLDIRGWEDFLKQPSCRQLGERPTRVFHVFSTTGLTNTRKGRQQSSTRPQDAVKGSNRGTCVVDERKRLREDDAIKGVRRNMVGAGQVGHDGCMRVVFSHIKHITGSNAATAISPSVGVVL